MQPDKQLAVLVLCGLFPIQKCNQGIRFYKSGKHISYTVFTPIIESYLPLHVQCLKVFNAWNA